MLRKNTPLRMDVQSLRKTIDHIEDYDQKIYAAATWYAENGFHIVPFRMGNKEGKYKGFPKVDPRDKSEKPEKLSPAHATCNPNTIRQWWHPFEGQYPGLGIALAHGGASGLCALDLDIDPDKGIDGVSVLADLQAAYEGSWDDLEATGGIDTLSATTPSGGRHFVFKFHPEVATNANAVYAGIDTRGGKKQSPADNGGITFVEPTKKPDRDGCYRWDAEPTDIIEPPQWLVDVLNGRKPPTAKAQLQDSYPAGSRDADIHRNLMSFVGAGYSEEDLWALEPEILARMDPPDPSMVQKIIKSVTASDIFKRAQEETQTAELVAGIDLLLDPKGKPTKSPLNLEAILRSALFEHDYGCIRFDDFTQRTTRNGVSMASRSDWAVGIQLWIARKIGVYHWSPAQIREMIESLVENDFEHINTARDYMLSRPAPVEHVNENFLDSDRKGPGPAFRRLCTEVLDLGNPNLHVGYNKSLRASYEGFLWTWLQGVAARACIPGCKMDIVINLFGAQGIGKSTFFERLCPSTQWFTDAIGESVVSGNSDKDDLAKLHAKIIVEMPELSPIKKGGKSADDRLKKFISARSDRMRAPYGKDTLDYPRTCAFAGTSNNRDVYRDATGNRRFLSIDHGDTPIRVGEKHTIIEEIRDALWGEVVNSFSYAELHPSNQNLEVSVPVPLRDKQVEINETHKYDALGAEELLEWAADKTRFTWKEIIDFTSSIPGVRDEKESLTMRTLRPILQNAGFTSANVRFNNAEGKQDKARVWINTKHELEIDRRSTDPVPPHWSTYTGDKPEY